MMRIPGKAENKDIPPSRATSLAFCNARGAATTTSGRNASASPFSTSKAAS